MLITTAFRIKTGKQDTKKDGTTAIYFYLNIEGEKRMIRTGKYVPPELFDNEKGVVKRGNGQSTKVNSVLEDFKSKYVSAIYDLEFRKKKVTHETVEALINHENGDDFLDFAFNELKAMSFTASPKYYEVLEYHLNTLKKYASNVSFSELTHDFLERYRIWMIRRGLKVNSMSGAFRCIRLFINKALLKDIQMVSPFTTFKIRSQEAKIEFLTLEEVVKLHDLYDGGSLSGRLQNTLHYFLVSCYTGLRRSDCSRLKQEHMEGGTLKILPKKTQRTGKEVRIPLSDRAKKLLNVETASFFERPLKQSHSRTNNDIREILRSQGITRHMTYHCSRHSFAVNCLTLGIPIEVVSSILGHSSIKTTQIYAKVVDEVKVREMKKWNF